MTHTRKMCKDCREVKLLSEFYVHPQMADGHLSKCKSCVKSRVSKHREENIETIQVYDRKRGLTPERKAKNAERRPRYKSKRTEWNREWRNRNPEKYAAHVRLNNAVRDGKVMKGVCEICGDPRSEAHHDDYSKPLDVLWLCVKHHGETRRIDT